MMKRKGLVQIVVGAALLCALCGVSGVAQTENKLEANPLRGEEPSTQSTQTFYLVNISQQNEAAEILTAIRNLLVPSSRVYFVPSQNAIFVSASSDQRALAQRIIADLDRPKRVYRLTYTLTELEGGKRIGVQHFAMVVVSGQRTQMKQGSRVPVVTGSYDPGKTTAQNTVSYLDVGLNFDATLDESANGVRLRTKAEQSSVAPETSGVGMQDPVVRQTMLEGTSILTPGKPLVLGSLDVPGSTRHQDVEVVMEVVR